MEYNVTECGGCGTRLETDLQDPCQCGSRKRVMRAGLMGGSLTLNDGPQGGVVFRPDPNKSWREQWNRALQGFDRVKGHYRPGDHKGDSTVQGDVETLFVALFHVSDWLYEDGSTGLSKTTVLTFVDADPSLTICRGFANTLKHHTLRNQTKVTASVNGVLQLSGGAAAVEIEWHDDQAAGTEDALDLARRCLAAWEDFLGQHNLTFLSPSTLP